MKRIRERMFSMVAEQPAILLILILLIAPVLSAVAVLGYQDIQLISTPGNPASGYVRFFGSGSALGCLTSSGGNCLNFGSGSVTSVGFTGGLISVANPTTTPAFTVAGTSGGIPYFSSASTWASSAAGTAGHVVLWGGAGSAPTDGGVPGTGTVMSVVCGSGLTGGTITTTGTCALVNPSQGFGASFGSVASGSSALIADTAYLTLPKACTIAAWNITVNAGTATFDIWKVATGTAIPTVTNSITASAQPAISTGTALHSTTLTSWTTSVAANDIVAINLKTVATATYASLVVQCD